MLILSSLRVSSILWIKSHRVQLKLHLAFGVKSLQFDVKEAKFHLLGEKPLVFWVSFTELVLLELFFLIARSKAFSPFFLVINMGDPQVYDLEYPTSFINPKLHQSFLFCTPQAALHKWLILELPCVWQTAFQTWNLTCYSWNIRHQLVDRWWRTNQIPIFVLSQGTATTPHTLDTPSYARPNFLSDFG